MQEAQVTEALKLTRCNGRAATSFYFAQRLENRLAVLLGGRAAEMLVFNEGPQRPWTTSARQPTSRATW